MGNPGGPSTKQYIIKNGRRTERKNQSMGERDEIVDQPTGASDDSSMKDTGVRRNSRTNEETQANEE